jgi:methylmalonyl-CoA/ethylmalonyl-CoA epimerase
MKKLLIPLVVVSLFLVSAAISDSSKSNNMKGLLDNHKMTQVGFIVSDIDQSARTWAEFLGMEVPEVILAEGHYMNPTTYRGESTDAKAKLAFFQLENITIELIEPVGENSTWREFLDGEGEKVHHIAFEVNEMDETVKKFRSFGIPMVQHGGWDGGEYGYMDGSEKLGVIVELLQNYKK